jgi:acyl-CoA dehydrogenase
VSFSLALTPAQQDLVERTHAFARDVIRPAAEYHDREQEFPWEILERAAREGFYNPLFYRDLIGDPTGLSLPLFMEELFWGCAGIGLSIVMPALALSAIAQAATPGQLLRWAPECFGMPGDLKLAALAISEPEGGSDVRNLRTTARREGDGWVIDGHKIWIGNGGIADVHVVNATVDPELGHKGQALFIVPKGTPGLTLVRKLDKLGCRASHTAEIRFDGCRVPADHLLGGDAKLERRLARARQAEAADGETDAAGAGDSSADETPDLGDAASAAGGTSADSNGRAPRGGSATLGAFEQTRPMVAAQALGIGRAALEFACDWAARREAFGGPILDKQGVSFPLADLAADLDAARLLTWRASWMAAQKVPYHHAEGSMSKLKASEVAVRITEQAIQVAGGWGYIRDHPVEKWYRDAKLYTIFEGTSEIQRLVIGRTLGDAATEPPLHHRTRTDGVALGRTLGRGTKRRSLAAGAAMRAAQKTPPALLRPAMKILGPPQKPRGD